MRRLLFAILLIVLFDSSSVFAQFFFSEKNNSLVGKKAPDFSLRTLSDQKMSLTQYRDGKSAIIFFWATWCPNCHEKMQQLSKAAMEIKDKSIQVVLVDIEEKAEAVDSYVKRNKIPYEVFLDEESKVSEDYNIIGVPTLFFVGKDGIIKSVEHSIPGNYQEILGTGSVQDDMVFKGKELYLSYGCAVCHGKDGDGKGISAGKFYPPPTNFHNAKSYQKGIDVESMRNAIKYGFKDEHSIMPAFDHFSDKELNQLTSFLKSLQEK